MNLYITQNIYYFVYRHFKRVFENGEPHIIIDTFQLPNILWLALVHVLRLTHSKSLFYLGEKILGFIYLRDTGILNEEDAIEVVV